MDDTGGNVTAGFPEELVERIIARIPFPYIFKARVLSKEWRSKFERVARAVSNDWPRYYPTFLHTRTNHLLGYDGVHNSWLRMELNSVQVSPRGSATCVAEGALLCMVDSKASTTIINLLTGKKRTIPYPPLFDLLYHYSYSSVIVPLDDENYQVVLYGIVHDPYGSILERRMYDFRIMTWCSKSVRIHHDFKQRYSAYLEGKLYYSHSLSPGFRSPTFVGVVNFEDEIARETSIGFNSERLVHETGVLRCGSRIIAFTIVLEVNTDLSLAQLFEVHSFNNTLVLVLLSESQVDRGLLLLPIIVADRDSIHFCGKSEITSYNVESKTWKSCRIHGENYAKYNICRREQMIGKRYSLVPVVFEPGLNPFIVP